MTMKNLEIKFRGGKLGAYRMCEREPRWVDLQLRGADVAKALAEISEIEKGFAEDEGANP